MQFVPNVPNLRHRVNRRRDFSDRRGNGRGGGRSSRRNHRVLKQEKAKMTTLTFGAKTTISTFILFAPSSRTNAAMIRRRRRTQNRPINRNFDRENFFIFTRGALKRISPSRGLLLVFPPSNVEPIVVGLAILGVFGRSTSTATSAHDVETQTSLLLPLTNKQTNKYEKAIFKDDASRKCNLKMLKIFFRFRTKRGLTEM